MMVFDIRNHRPFVFFFIVYTDIKYTCLGEMIGLSLQARFFHNCHEKKIIYIVIKTAGIKTERITKISGYMILSNVTAV